MISTIFLKNPPCFHDINTSSPFTSFMTNLTIITHLGNTAAYNNNTHPYKSSQGYLSRWKRATICQYKCCLCWSNTIVLMVLQSFHTQLLVLCHTSLIPS
ncbi:hypothetical protein FKM82_004927 [Ascaphus truei]